MTVGKGRGKFQGPVAGVCGVYRPGGDGRGGLGSKVQVLDDGGGGAAGADVWG